MNRDLKMFLLIIFVIISNIVDAQNLPDPITGGNGPDFGIITSDYGPRCITAGSNPHPAIDYAMEQGGHAYAVDNGSITYFGNWGTNIAFIEVGSWRYLHVESDHLEDWTWEFVPNFFGPNVDYDDFIFLREIDQNNDLTTIAVLATTEYDHVVTIITDERTNETLSLSTNVTQGDWIFTPTNFGTNINPNYHLDIRRRNDNINPLLYISLYVFKVMFTSIV